MLNIKISDSGQKVIEKLGIDIEESLYRIVENIPKMDLIGLNCISVTDKPGEWKEHLINASGTYFEKTKTAPAYIELYLSRLFAHINKTESSKLMIPFQDICLAQTVFHEIGHHVEKTRSHGINKKKRETFAKNYEHKLLSRYLTSNAASINTCFKNLDAIDEEKGLSREILSKMKDGWESHIKNMVN